MNIERLLTEYVLLADSSDAPDAPHVVGMCTKLGLAMFTLGHHGTNEREDNLGKFNRWLAWVQGWLYCHGLRTIDQLRDETRGVDAALRNL